MKNRLLFTLLLFHCVFVASASGPSVHFSHLTIEDGLSQNTISSIVQDHKGFLWFATQDGLNRYDGYTFKVFRHDAQDSGSISGNNISVLFVDALGTLWLGTQSGLNRYDSETEQFYKFIHDSKNRNSISHNFILSLAQDGQGRLWIGTYGGGLNLLDPSTGQFKQFGHNKNDAGGLSHNKVWSLLYGSKGDLWIGTSASLARLDAEDQPRIGQPNVKLKLTHYRPDSNDPNSISYGSTRALVEDAQGKLWVGTYRGLNRLDSDDSYIAGQKTKFSRFNLNHHYIKDLFKDRDGVIWAASIGGLSRYNDATGTFVHFEHHPADKHSLSDTAVDSIYQDKLGIMWIGTDNSGISKFDAQSQRFGHFNHQANDLKSLSNNIVRAIYKSPSGVLWVGTEKGLNRYNKNDRTFDHFVHSSADPNSLSHNFVSAIFQDSHGILWVATDGGGVNRFDDKTAQFSRFSDDQFTQFSRMILAIAEDVNGDLWFGSQSDGLTRFDRKNRRFQIFKHNPQDPNSLRSDRISVIFSDANGRLWIGTRGGGLNRFDFRTETFTSYQHQASSPDSLSNNTVYSINQDSAGIIWVGTQGGLNKFELNAEKFTRYGTKQGLPNDYVLGIVPGERGQLWISTIKGLSRFDTVTERFRNYDVNDGLQSNEFNFKAFFKSHDGELFFGGINGFNRFYPEHIVDDKQLPDVVLTDFLLANQAVSIDKGIDKDFTLPKVIDDMKRLTLSHRQNLITFEFAALHFANPMKNRYAYKLEGQDDDWIYADAKNRRATYTNLPDGHYTLRVKATNHHGYWNEQGKSLDINVLPPPWKTWWAYLLYSLAIILIIVMGVANVFRAQRQRMHKHLQKVRDQQILNRQLKEIDKLKDEFLANTSHELRTPLNGIIGLAESLMDGVAGPLPECANHNLAMVVSSGRRLENIVNDILDFSKLKNHRLALTKGPVDIYSLVEVVLALSRPLLGKKPVKLINDTYKDLPSVDADENRLMQIMHNLVGNAIKFTDAGSVTVSAVPSSKMKDQSLTISIQDTGIGIDACEFDHIFESFEQVEGGARRGRSGTGLGLAVTKQLIELHGGTIMVESEPGQGSTFSFTLLKSELQGATLSAENSINQQTLSRLHKLEQVAEQALPVSGEAASQNGQAVRILLVDDEPINRQVVSNLLSLQNYQLVEATGGEQALAIIRDEGPFDLVLLDIMMPCVSGYEVCRQLRETFSMSDLPVIFLTAKNQVGDLVQSFAMGGNDYLTKPVAKHELLARVQTHLKLQDINRNLEQKVAERTEDLERKHQDLLNTEKELAQKEHQRKLAQSETLASLGTLTAGIGHEINNPVNFIGLGAHALGNDLKVFESYLFELAGQDAEAAVLDGFRQQLSPLYKHIDTIVDGTDRVKVIVQDLRSFTQQDSAEQQIVVISDKLQSTLNLVKPKYIDTIDFDVDFDDSLQLQCYPAQLNQVFINLLVNACDAICERRGEMKGQPTYGKPISTEQGKVDVGCRQVADAVEIFVRDNGNGMSDETQNRLFEPFYTTKGQSKGTGLGLSISYGIMQKHGGELTVSSQLGVGTTFVMRLPG